MIGNVPRAVDPAPIVDQLKTADYVEIVYLSLAAVRVIWEAPALLDAPGTTRPTFRFRAISRRRPVGSTRSTQRRKPAATAGT
jgi:hypothetical protein